MTGKEEFAARMARIQSGRGVNTLGQIHVGAVDDSFLPRRPGGAAPATPEVVRNLAYPLSLLGAACLGVVSVGLGRYARYHLAHDMVAPDADVEMAINLGLGLLVSFVLAQAFRLTSKEHKALQGIGVFLMVGLFHNLAHWAPDAMARAFSPAYVRTELAQSPEGTFLFRGAYFPIFDHDSLLVETPDAVPSEVVAPCPEVPAVEVLKTEHGKKHRSSHKQVKVAEPDPHCVK